MLQNVYLSPVTDHILPAISTSKRRHTLEPGASAERRQQRILTKFERRLHSLFVQALPERRLALTISHVTYDCACKMFQLHIEGGALKTQKLGVMSGTEKELMVLLQALQKVGLGGDRAQRAFAYAMDKLMNEFMVSHWMKVDWDHLSSVTRKLRRWIKHGFSPFVRTVVAHLGGDNNFSTPEDDAQRWLDMALARLGRARIANLFDYIVNWDRSLGAILDIKARGLLFAHQEFSY
jgi:anaphase-promoting complex subunit 2